MPVVYALHQMNDFDFDLCTFINSYKRLCFFLNENKFLTNINAYSGLVKQIDGCW